MTNFNDSISPQPPEQSLSVEALSQRLSQLEQRFDQAMMLLSDLYRYDQLRDLLAAGKFKEADEETTRIMLEIAGEDHHDNITPDEIMLFPCNALRLLNQLWLKYSDGRFGFSIQQQFYTELGGTDDISNIDLKVLQEVGDRVGWRQKNQWLDYDELDFSLSAPPGCHPSGWWRSAYGAKMAVYFLARIIRCNVV